MPSITEFTKVNLNRCGRGRVVGNETAAEGGERVQEVRGGNSVNLVIPTDARRPGLRACPIRIALSAAKGSATILECACIEA